MDLAQFYRELDRLYATPGADVAGYLDDALRRCRASRDLRGCCACANELGSVMRLQGKLAESEALYRELLGWLDALDAAAPERARASINLGDVYVAQGCPRRALEMFDAAEELLGSEDTYPNEISAICNNRSAAWRALGAYAKARLELRRAQRLLEHVPGSYGKRCTNALNLVQILIDEGRTAEADELMPAVLEAYETLGGGRDVHRPYALAAAAQLAFLEGRYGEAAERYGQAADVLAEKLGDAAPNVAALRRKAQEMVQLARRQQG